VKKFKIPIEERKQLTFEDLMIVKTRRSGFFYEFKKNRTNLLKETEPVAKERFYRKYIREKQEEEETER
jgi:hypothetical protein